MALFYRILLATVALDQASKWLVVQGLNLASVGEIRVFPPWLVFRMAWNRGINFGVLSTPGEAMRWVLSAIALAISLWVWLWARRERRNPMVQLSAGMLIGGALGNVIDRLVYGAVADFLNVSCCGIENPYAFNVADIAVFLGAAGLVLWSGKSGTRPTRPR